MNWPRAWPQPVTRRGALKKFGVGLAGIALAALGLANKAEAGSGGAYKRCVNKCKQDCAKFYPKGTAAWEACWSGCAGNCPLPI